MDRNKFQKDNVGTIKLGDCIRYADSIKIIFNDKCINKFLENEKVLHFTFREVMQIAAENGWNDSALMLIAENPVRGKIYQYGNYGNYNQWLVDTV